MKVWQVYLVGASRRRIVKVTADYWRVDEHGSAVFRNSPTTASPYPTNVHTFASGVWSDVKLVGDAK